MQIQRSAIFQQAEAFPKTSVHPRKIRVYSPLPPVLECRFKLSVLSKNHVALLGKKRWIEINEVDVIVRKWFEDSQAIPPVNRICRGAHVLRGQEIRVQRNFKDPFW